MQPSRRVHAATIFSILLFQGQKTEERSKKGDGEGEGGEGPYI